MRQGLSNAIALGVSIPMALALAGGAEAEHWPSFRGRNAAGVSTASNVPLEWSARSGANILWKAPIPGLGHSSPIVWGERVFVTTAISAAAPQFQHDGSGGRNVVDDDAPHEWRVYCLDRRTGAILWQRTAQRGRPRVKRHVRSSHANATPATDGRYLAAFFGSEGLYVYDLDGNPLWQRDLGVLDAGYVGLPDYQWESASSPIIHGDLVIVQCDSRSGSFVAAFEIVSGREAWRSPRDENPSWATPIVVSAGGRDELITSSPRYFRGLDPRSGRELWRFFDGADVKVPTPVSGHGLLYLSGGAPQGRQFYAIRPGGEGELSAGAGSSSRQLAWMAEKGGPYVPTPLVYGEHLYVLTDIGVLTCHDARTGAVVSRGRVPASGGTYNASPVAANGHLYLASADGVVYVVRAGPALEIVAANPMDEALLATPALTEAMILIRTRQHVVAVRASR